jgi:hypothetical protein
MYNVLHPDESSIGWHSPMPKPPSCKHPAKYSLEQAHISAGHTAEGGLPRSEYRGIYKAGGGVPPAGLIGKNSVFKTRLPLFRGFGAVKGH